MVRIQTGTIKEFIKKCTGKRVICFGAGKHFNCILKCFSKEGLYRYVDEVVDNNKELWGKKKRFNNKLYPIISFDKLCEHAKTRKIIILITNHWYFNEIIEQLDQEILFDQVEVYLGDLFASPIVLYPPFKIQAGAKQKIPKIIHYCWFGNGQIPSENLKYMESWKKHCPDYEIRLWNESNYDVTKNQYMKQAYDKKKWAFVSDYARIDIVHKYGGIYLDCDVELLRPLDDFLYVDMYCGFEEYKYINLGLGYGAVAGHPYLSSLLEYYEHLTFISGHRKLNLTPCPFYQTEIIKQYGICPENSFQQTEQITVYPTEVFAPYSYWGLGKVTAQTYSIHHYSASWQNDDRDLKFVQWKIQMKRLYERIQVQEGN